MRGGADRVRVADRLNVAERLAEGRPAAEHTQSYVRACHLVGYQHPDLTAYPAQIHDWYGSEDGLDLHALDADCAQLRAAASVLMEALRMERSQVAVLAAAWTGSGADAAVHFVQRHCETGNSVVTEVRAAAQRCESLRDNLWQLVDSKVATAIAIDERALAQRPAWLIFPGPRRTPATMSRATPRSKARFRTDGASPRSLSGAAATMPHDAKCSNRPE